MKRRAFLLVTLLLSLSFGAAGQVDWNKMSTPFDIKHEMSVFSHLMKEDSQDMDAEVISIRMSDTTYLLKDKARTEFYLGRVKQSTKYERNKSPRLVMVRHGYGVSREWKDSVYVYAVGKWKRGFLDGHAMVASDDGHVFSGEWRMGSLVKGSLRPAGEAEETEARKGVSRINASIRAMQGRLR